MTAPHAPSTTQSLPELLAPAGSMDAFRAALEAGADAVYLGLSSLNARRGAENFTPQTLPEAVRLAHAAGARVFLTLNILLTAREVGEAARTLELARSCGVDAVLIADPALLLFRPHYPELDFHFSTQAATMNSAGVQAAALLGVNRAVLARELKLSEIVVAAKSGHATGQPPVETEVFVQGALCLCVSGRCLLSSWGGGRSGNRGACTSPCRVRWNVNGSDAGTPLSMHDLCALAHLPELIESGVRCLKIEGRLKNAGWVRQAVGLYRQALRELDHPAADAPGSDREAMLRLAQERSDKGNRYASSDGADQQMPRAAEGLTAYAGRQLTDNYLTGSLQDMTGESGRAATPEQDNTPTKATGAEESAPRETVSLTLHIDTTGDKLCCRLATDGAQEEFLLTKTVIHRPDRAITIGQAAEWLLAQGWKDATLTGVSSTDDKFLIPKKAANQMADAIGAFLHRQAKAAAGPSKHLGIALPDEVKLLTVPPKLSAQNNRHLGNKPNMVRLSRTQAAIFLRSHSPEAVVVDNLIEDLLQAQVPYQRHAGQEPAKPFFFLQELKALVTTTRLVVALPAVFFEDVVPIVAELCLECARLEVPVEVNGWDGWQLARAAGAEIWGGPGLAVLNPQAALALREQGFRTVTFSAEAGERQLADIARHLPLPGMLCVYGRPVLVYTRAGLPATLRTGAIIEDSRKIRLRIERCGGLTRLRAVEPFNIAHQRNEAIRARWLCADLCGSADPAGEWLRLRQPEKNPHLFNFQRGLY